MSLGGCFTIAEWNGAEWNGAEWSGVSGMEWSRMERMYYHY